MHVCCVREMKVELLVGSSHRDLRKLLDRQRDETGKDKHKTTTKQKKLLDEV